MQAVSNFDAIVLAGGRGRRMGEPEGTDKAMLAVGGVRLLARVVDAVADAGTVVVVGPRRPIGDVGRADVVWTSEQPPGRGPAAALVHGLAQVHADTVVVLATDVPFAASAVPRLLSALAAHDAAMLVDESGRRQPLVAAYRSAALRARADAEDWADRSVRALVAGLDVVEVAAAGLEALDCDTPADLAAARSAVETGYVETGY